MPAEPATLAIDVGATSTRVAIVRNGTVADRRLRRTTDLRDADGVGTGIVTEAHALLASSGASVIAVGMGLAAAVDPDGMVLQEREFGIPAGPDLRDLLAAAFEVPVAVNNDANLAALAEHRLGAARGHDHAAVITLGSNIGLGLIVNGAIHRGAHGMAGEVGLLLVPVESKGSDDAGHRRVDAGRFGTAISAAPEGYAWVEEVVGGKALADAARGIGSVAERVMSAEALADPRLRPLVDRALEGWALIIADLSVLLDLEVVVLTGSVAGDAAHLLETLRQRVAELVAIPPEVVLGSLGPDAELLGADLYARAALDQVADRYAGAGPSAQSTGERR